MNAKPILFWPKPRSDIALHLDRDSDDFLVVDTNSAYELQKLYNIRRDTAIFDPFPEHGAHYRDFIDHVAASDCRCHIVGIKACQDVLQALNDPLLAHSPIEEIFAAINPAGSSSHPHASSPDSKAGSMLRPLLRRSAIKMSLPLDWSYLNWASTSLLAILVLVSTLIADVVSPNSSLLAAVIATLLFVALYVCIRANFSKLFSFMTKRPNFTAKDRPMARLGQLRSWLKSDLAR
jgi:hypothetical protein